MKKLSFKIIIITLLLLTIIGVVVYIRIYYQDKNNEEIVTSEVSEKQFKIYLIEERHIDNLSYDYQNQQWSEFIENVELKDIFIDEEDISKYDWSSQEITLTKSASERIISTYSKDMFAYEEKIFIVTLKGERLYGGAILSYGSARGIKYPVIYLNIEIEKADEVILLIRPYHSFLKTYMDIPSDAKGVIEFEEIKSYFSQIQKLAL